MLKTSVKQKLIAGHKTHDKDTGSTEVQIALVSSQIAELTKHLKDHPKDVHSRRGLLAMVAKRKRLLNYLSKKNAESYAALIKKLGLRK